MLGLHNRRSGFAGDLVTSLVGGVIGTVLIIGLSATRLGRWSDALVFAPLEVLVFTCVTYWVIHHERWRGH